MIEYSDLIFVGISIVISIIILLVTKILLKTRLTNLTGTKKLLGLISIVVFVVEGAYLGLTFGLFQAASEVIASIGVAFALVTFALQNHLKNIVSGIGLYLNSSIEIGDIIEIDGQKGVIIDFHLMKTTALTEEGKYIFIPNLTFNESVTIISHRQKSQK